MLHILKYPFNKFSEGSFRWGNSSADSLNETFSNWNEDEPNNFNDDEDCVEMKIDNGRWNDVGCGWIIFYTMCEKFLDATGIGYVMLA